MLCKQMEPVGVAAPFGKGAKQCESACLLGQRRTSTLAAVWLQSLRLQQINPRSPPTKRDRRSPAPWAAPSCSRRLFETPAYWIPLRWRALAALHEDWTAPACVGIGAPHSSTRPRRRLGRIFALGYIHPHLSGRRFHRQECSPEP